MMKKTSSIMATIWVLCALGVGSCAFDNALFDHFVTGDKIDFCPPNTAPENAQLSSM